CIAVMVFTFAKPVAASNRYWATGADVQIFFSSRRRHTRWPRDWSSDVCSSDLAGTFQYCAAASTSARRAAAPARESVSNVQLTRSEERRVGKECRYRLSLHH